MGKFILLYDCPLKTCDKKWLYDGLAKNGKVKVIGILSSKSYFRIKRFMPRLRIGLIVVKILRGIQNVRCIVSSKKDDIIVVWAHNQGYVISNICSRLKLKRKIVSFMWISLPKKHKSEISRAFKNENFIPIINNKDLEQSFIELFDLKKWNGLFLPDVFDDSQVFDIIKFRQRNRYVFAGGVNNRDWNVLIDVARKTPEIKYIIVCNKGDIRNPNLNNLAIIENLSVEEYYKTMSGAFATVCPLKEDRTSGLINVLKSSQFGIPCISTNLGVTSMYYCDKIKTTLLYKIGDSDDLRKKIVTLYNMDEEKYIAVAQEFQQNIIKNFCPDNSIEKLITELQKRGWLSTIDK